MLFEWDHQKDLLNQKKHGVSFKEAEEVFEDPLHISILDHRFSYFEERWLTIGKAQRARLLVLAHLYFNEEGEETIRIISAREATKHEQENYEAI
jgi:uncharacterized protein